MAGSGHRIQTGFAGTPYVLDALSTTGHLDEAYRLLLQRECPSWLYTVMMGATTMWERWDSMLPNGTINPGQMTSFNHYALGAVADWMHRNIGGIAPLDPGYSRVLIAPQPGGDIRWARSSLQTRHGKISVSWTQDAEGPIELDIVVPDGVAAMVQLPGTDMQELGSGQHHLSTPDLSASDVRADWPTHSCRLRGPQNETFQAIGAPTASSSRDPITSLSPAS